MTFFNGNSKICQFTNYPEAESNVQWSKHDEKILELKKGSMLCICVCMPFPKGFFFFVVAPLFEELSLLPLFYS